MISKSKTDNPAKKGFSILEVIISVAVLSIGLVAAVGLIAGSIADSLDSRNHIIASSLAQEGIELVRNIRDNSWLDATGTDPFDDFPNVDAINCRIDKDQISVTGGDCNNNPNRKKLEYVGGFYIHSNTTDDVKFQRRIGFSGLGTSKVTVTSTVVWGRSDLDFPATCDPGNKCVYIEDELTNWRR